MYTSNEKSWGRTFEDGCVYPNVERRAPPQNERLSTGAVRLRYPFRPPLSNHIKMIHGERSDDWHVKNNERFDIFFYLPVPILSDPKAKSRDLVVMFNGTNETRPYHSRLYDRFGESLAQHNIAAVLLPTPFHLNRTVQRKRRRPLKKKWEGLIQSELVTPTKVAEPHRPYGNFYQTSQEVDRLIELVHGQRAADDPWGLYERLFGKNTRISLLGFSMGGLRALAKILMEPDKIHKAIILSSGGTFASLSPPDVKPPSRWARFAAAVRGLPPEDLLKRLGKTAPDFYRELYAVFFDEDLGIWGGQLEKLAMQNRILVVLGTRDPMTPQAIARMKGAELRTIPGMGHRLGEDIPFELRYPDIIEMVVRFLEPTRQRLNPWPRGTIREELTVCLRQLYGSLARASAAALPNRIWRATNNPGLRARLIELYLLSKARFASDAELIDSIRRNLK